MEERLRELGDPSGQQTDSYWNEWFNIVCESRDSFEWYTGASEVARILQKYDTTTGSRPKMLHAGSGNSLVPFELRDKYAFPHEHIVVDISTVAIEGMQKLSEKDASDNQILYVVANLLQPPLPAFKSEAIDAWVDKGLVDALFHSSTDEPNALQCRTLFQEAFRVIRPNGGHLFIITMAEEHSLQLILDNIWPQLQSARLHVYEMEPLSGELRPFGFVLQRSTEDIFDPNVSWFSDDPSTPSSAIEASDLEDLKAQLAQKCQESRQAFRSQLKDETFCTLEIKPWDSEVDLEQLKELITQTTWKSTTSNIKVVWQECKFVPVGYGISKLVMQCIVNTNDLDDLVEAIQEWGGDSVIEDGVQSVDVDWTQTRNISDLPTIGSALSS